jgi:hypothetical protein
MRIVHVILTLGIVISGFQVSAQEDDDMYFNAKDREKLKAAQASENTTLPSFREESENPSTEPASESVNPTDSYSSRNTNPEFEARSIAETAQEDEANYFVNDYRYNTAKDLNNFNNNYDSWSNSSMYNSNYYGSAINNWNSPYYGSSSAFYSPWGNPYWNNSGWSASFSYYWGNNYGYWNNPYNSYYNPYSYGYGYGYNPYGYGYYSPYSYYGSGYGYGCPGTIVVVNNNSGDYVNRVSYGKRPTRGGAHVSPHSSDYVRTGRTRSNLGSSSNSDPVISNGRVSTNNTAVRTSRSNAQDEYYSRSWRSRVNQTRSDNDDNTSRWGVPSGSQSDSNRPQRSSRSSYNPGSNSNSGNSNSTLDHSYTPSRSSNSSSGSSYTPSRSSNSGSGSSYTPSRSSSSGSGSSYTPSRSSGGGSSSGGSSSGGGSRGRTRGN